MAKQHFPGYREDFTLTNELVVGWQILLFSKSGKQDVYQALQAGAMAEYPYLDISVCPSDNTVAGKSKAWTSYIVNTGRFDIVNTTTAAITCRPAGDNQSNG